MPSTQRRSFGRTVPSSTPSSTSLSSYGPRRSPPRITQYCVMPESPCRELYNGVRRDAIALLALCYAPTENEEHAMARTARAVLCRELGKPVVVETIEVAAPRRGEVTVQIAACGVCHSDLSATNGTIQMKLPLVLGHEAAGVVAEVGEGVTDFAPGDHVISSFVYMCGRCRWCTTGKPHLCDMAAKTLYTLPDGTTPARDAAGNPLSIFSACGVMAEYATLAADNLVKVEKDIPLDRAALVSCGVMTGVGAVFNTAKVEPGTAVMVIGTGGGGPEVRPGAAVGGAAPNAAGAAA